MRRLSMLSVITIVLATLVGTSLINGVASAATPHHARLVSQSAVRINHRTGLPVGAQPTRRQLARTAAQHNASSRQLSSLRTASSPGYHLTYNGGPVISNVQLQPVRWGSGSYISQVSNTTAPSMQSFLGNLASGPYAGLLSEYSVTGQTIGAGTVSDPLAITPSVGTPGSTVTDSEIRQELVDQIFNEPSSPLYQATPSAATLANTPYVLYFPAGVRICADSPADTCSDNAFCGYHSSFTVVDPSQTPIGNVRYIVLPDPDANWVSGCHSATAKTPFTALQSVASHEVAETITDPEPNENTAWYDADPTGQSDPGEIGDICESAQWPYQDTSYIGGDRHGYVIQNVWSNTKNECLPRIAASVTSAPGAFSLGSSAHFGFATTDAAGAAGHTYDVAYKAAKWNGSWGPLKILTHATTQPTASLPLSPGTEYCVVVRSFDPQGFVSRWSAPHCTAAPVDDRTFAARTTGWARSSASSAFRHTLTRTGKVGAKLSISNGIASRLGLVVETCSTCGNVQIFLGSSLWKTVSTKSSSTHYEHLALPGTFSLRKTTITLRVASGQVILDGLGLLRSAPSF